VVRLSAWRTQFREAGWKEDVVSFARMSGALSFSKQDGHSVTLTYTDTGIMYIWRKYEKFLT